MRNISYNIAIYIFNSLLNRFLKPVRSYKTDVTQNN